MRLSRDRANSVKAFLVNSGVPAIKLKIKAFGETHPIADNSTEAGRRLNRRVEFKIIRSINTIHNDTLTLLLRPLIADMNTSKSLFDTYSKAKTYTNARDVFQIDTAMLNLLNRRTDLMPANLAAARSQLAVHLTAWISNFRRMAKLAKSPNGSSLNEVTYNGPAFPDDAAAAFNAEYKREYNKTITHY